MNFLEFLRDDIRAGLAKKDSAYRERHANWLRAQQRPEGGFANRRGKADLYYTAFALRALSALNALTPEIAQRAHDFLENLAKQSDTQLIRQPHGAFCDAVMAGSWWDSLILCEESGAARLSDEQRGHAERVTFERLKKLRRSDFGWAKSDVEQNGGLYHAFLASALYVRLGKPIPDAEEIRKLARNLAQPDGGFLESKFSRRPGTNGTVAGVFLSLMLNEEELDSHINFVASMHSSEGGFQATPNAPIADLLSTYTAMLTLKFADKLTSKILSSAAKYVRSLEDPEGGYAGFALETIVDCEYAFYGLGCESILANFKQG